MTLVELVVVVLIMGISVMIVLIAGHLSLRDTEELKAQARTLAGFLETVRLNAAVKGRSFFIEYNLDEQKYFAWVPKEPKEGDVIDPESNDALVQGVELFMPNRYNAAGQREFSTWIDRVAMGDGKGQSRGLVKIEFTARGGSHWHYVYLRNKNNEFYTIEVNPFTGLAEVHPGELKPEPPEKVRR
ncbi:MAG: hypothetical protein IT462_13505 [Planctomycetes bacterium]|nr:hypothetical protein [Planctomycetota bacterium]